MFITLITCFPTLINTTIFLTSISYSRAHQHHSGAAICKGDRRPDTQPTLMSSFPSEKMESARHTFYPVSLSQFDTQNCLQQLCHPGWARIWPDLSHITLHLHKAAEYTAAPGSLVLSFLYYYLSVHDSLCTKCSLKINSSFRIHPVLLTWLRATFRVVTKMTD